MGSDVVFSRQSIQSSYYKYIERSKGSYTKIINGKYYDNVYLWHNK